MSQPSESTPTPVAAISAALSGVMPPEASVTARPATSVTASRIWSGVMLSSRITSAPASRASRTWARSVTSTSTFTRWPTAAFARRTASPTPPATATWLSLMSTASSRPKRWLEPPPTRTAYFSRARSPGVVLRVSATRAPVPATRATTRRVWVAMPQRRPSRFSATRSADRIARAGPDHHGQHRPGGHVVAVGRPELHLHPGVEQGEGPAGDLQAGHPPFPPGHQVGPGLGRGRHHGVGGDVADAAQVLPQGGLHQRLVEQRRRGPEVAHVSASSRSAQAGSGAG